MRLGVLMSNMYSYLCFPLSAVKPMSTCCIDRTKKYVLDVRQYSIYRISARLGRPRRYAVLDDTPQILLHKSEFSPPKKVIDLVFTAGAAAVWYQSAHFFFFLLFFLGGRLTSSRPVCVCEHVCVHLYTCV